MPIVLNEWRAQTLAYKEGEKLKIDFFGNEETVTLKTIEDNLVTIVHSSGDEDILAHSDMTVIVGLPDLSPNSTPTSAQPLTKLLCFNMSMFSKYQLFNLGNGQVGIANQEAQQYEYSPPSGAPDLSLPLGGAVCSPPAGYPGATALPANAAGAAPTVAVGGVLTRRGASSDPSVVLVPASNSNSVNGFIFKRQYINAPADTTERAVPLDA